MWRGHRRALSARCTGDLHLPLLQSPLQQFPLPVQDAPASPAHLAGLFGQQTLGLVQHTAPQMKPPETGVPAQTPLVQTSLFVHGSLSSHLVPLAFAGLEQIPVAGLQVPRSWH